jgi:gliding motility-associated-like protein
MQQKLSYNLKYLSNICLLLFFCNICCAQRTATNKTVSSSGKSLSVKPLLHALAGTDTDLFGTKTRYIENIGQYGTTFPGYSQLGNILYGYEGLNMPVLLSQKGIVHLQRKIKKLSEKEMERLERKGMSEEEIREKVLPINKTIAMEWVNANPNPEIVAEEPAGGYHTYGLLKGKARAFAKITYKNIYPGIDAVYSFLPGVAASQAGYEYSLIIRPEADISAVKMKFSGDVNKIKKDKEGNLIISSNIEDIIQTAPACYYATDKSEKLSIAFDITNKEVSFKLDEDYKRNSNIIIDPFVTSTANLTGNYSGIAKDIDFDYEGNVYVSGGGTSASQKMAKFNEAGVLQWTFSGSLTMPVWNFGGSEGGWVVEKSSGKIYLGQGLAGPGFRIIRLNTAGVYDNYITNLNASFGENWKMLWNCNGGIPKILIAGGGGSANNELAILTPPSLDPSISNISGLTGGHNDISDIIIDPVSNDMYSIFSISVNTPNSDSKIYKHKPPYSPATMAWSSFSGYFAHKEPRNRPYLMGGLDNSSNSLAMNAEYLFYWDGKNLKAFSKSSGAVAGTPVTLPNTELAQGGIFADECNNVFVGSTAGTIKVYKFDGITFNDAAAADISITGFSTNAVFDMAYDHGKNLLYACGNGFVTSIDVSQYCALPVYTVTVTADPVTLSATAALTPAPPAGSIISFSLFDGTALLTSNTTGIFTGLTLGINYTVKVYIDEACGGTQAVKDFVLALAPLPIKTGIYIPNAFTPNGDGLNETLKVFVSGMKEFHYFTIYNRYGQMIFTTTDAARGWDGKVQGKMQNTGSFVWLVEVVDQSGQIIQQKGATTLIR